MVNKAKVQEEGKDAVQVYEVGYLVLPSIPEDKLTLVVDKIRDVVTKAGGQELDGEEPFKTDLSYTMTKTIGASRYVVSDAYLGWIKFELEPSQALAVKAEVEKIDEIIRFLLIKVPRETNFSFAKAQAALAEKEAALEEVEAGPAEEPVIQ